MTRLLPILVVLLFWQQSNATHIVGGEIFYDCLGANNYRITVKVYRDCGPANTLGTPFDASLPLTIYDAAGNLFGVFSIAMPTPANVPAVNSNPCLFPPPLCIEVATYQTVVNLPPSAGGYTAVYQRCCRNSAIQNLFDPNNSGGTYFINIPDPGLATCNNSARFNNLPPMYICINNDFEFDHSATDPDGDSLVYSFYTPLQGGNSTNPAPNPCSPPPYSPLLWNPGYGTNNQINGSPALSIDPNTGLLTCNPNIVGIYVYAVKVSEYRNGQLLCESLREFQITVANCLITTSIVLEQDTVQFCGGMTVNFTNNSINAFEYHWDFGDPSTTADTSNLLNPTYTYTDTGTFYVTLIANPGSDCTDTMIQPFQVHVPIDATFDPPNPQCVDVNLFHVEALGSFTSGATIQWTLPGSLTPSASGATADFSYPDSGYYPVTVTVQEFGCTSTHTDTLVVHPLPVVGFSYPQQLACEPYTVQFMDTSLSWSPISYLWDFGDGTTSTESNPVHTYADTGIYSVTLTIQVDSICVVTETITLNNIIHVFPSPDANVFATPRQQSVLTPTIEVSDLASGHISSIIYFGDGDSTLLPHAVHYYQDTGWQYLYQRVINEYGCIDTAEAPVYIIPETNVFIPNAFSPNGDGINDVFLPVVRDTRRYRFTIFNRWGEIIFETNDPLQGWDGRRNNKLMKTDLYVYRVTFMDQAYINHEKNGHFSLLK